MKNSFLFFSLLFVKQHFFSFSFEPLFGFQGLLRECFRVAAAVVAAAGPALRVGWRLLTWPRRWWWRRWAAFDTVGV
jgi:hypothetical protein